MPSLFERSLVKIGKNALAIVVPKAWARCHNLKAGDKLEVIADGKLVVRPKKKQ